MSSFSSMDALVLTLVVNSAAPHLHRLGLRSSTLHPLASSIYCIVVVPGSLCSVLFRPYMWTLQSSQWLLLWSTLPGLLYDWDLTNCLMVIACLSCPIVTINRFSLGGVGICFLILVHSVLKSWAFSVLWALYYLTSPCLSCQAMTPVWAGLLPYRLPPPVKCCDTAYIQARFSHQFSHRFWSWFFWALLLNKFVLDVFTWLALLALPNSFRSVLLKAIFRTEGI